jgi:hypothetical protein
MTQTRFAVTFTIENVRRLKKTGFKKKVRGLPLTIWFVFFSVIKLIHYEIRTVEK